MAKYTQETITGTLLYVCIQQPTKKYESDETEWKVSLVVDKKQAKEWNKRFSKQKAKEIDNAEFESIYKIQPPFSEQDEQYVLKISQNTHTADGKAMYQPKAYEDIGANNVVEITNTKLVGNGSLGSVSYTVVENKFGTFAKLNALLVTDLIEYQKAGSNPFGKQVVVGTVVDKESVAPVVKQDTVIDDDDDSLPF